MSLKASLPVAPLQLPGRKTLLKKWHGYFFHSLIACPTLLWELADPHPSRNTSCLPALRVLLVSSFLWGQAGWCDTQWDLLVGVFFVAPSWGSCLPGQRQKQVSLMLRRHAAQWLTSAEDLAMTCAHSPAPKVRHKSMTKPQRALFL